ncbi:MAG: carbohydrate binding domain-containing protein [Puniceicoccales bacterium]
MLIRKLVALFALGLTSAHVGAFAETAPAQEGPGSPGWFPFAITGDMQSDSVTDFSALLREPAGEDGFVEIKDGHFYTGDERLRIWGVNVTFEANFPTHEDAEKVAKRLAGLGVNAVRIHHHDMGNTPRGIWQPAKGGHREMDPGQLELQDYFFNQLNERGIYLNLNLHVSRSFTKEEGFIDRGDSRAFMFDKYLLYFVPEMRERFKEFCREYLWHRNPYRDNMRRVDDPGIAMVEITNENAFSTHDFSIIDDLAEPYRKELQKQWNTWLIKRYGTTAKLLKAWEPSADQRLGAVRVGGDDFGKNKPTKPWWLHAGKGDVEMVPDQPGPQKSIPALRLDIIKQGEHVQSQELMCQGLTIEKGKAYTVSYWVRSDEPRGLYVDVSNSGPTNWNGLGYTEKVSVTTQWQHVIRPFIATSTNDGDARLCFKFGKSAANLELAGVTLQEGAAFVGLGEGESLEAANVPLPGTGSGLAMLEDGHQFFMDVEVEFIQDMTRYLRDDLGVKVPITGSQASYHGAHVTAESCEYVDMHGYWHHPSFPGKSWDRNNWFVKNIPMEQFPGKDTLTRAGTWRILGRPFTVSEWMIPSPNNFAASTAPFAGVLAALQDWDGVFFFNYHTLGGQWDIQGLYGFFNLTGDPVKLALMGVSANLYVRGDLKPLSKVAAGTLNERPSPLLAFERQIGIDPELEHPTVPSPDKFLSDPDGQVVWQADAPRKARLIVNTPATRGLFGLVADSETELDGLTMSIGSVDRDYACVFVSSYDGSPLEEASRLVLVAVGRAESPGMAWNEDRTTVGNDWGRGPAEVNGIPVTFTLDASVSAVYALAGDGKRLGSVPVTKAADGSSTWTIGPDDQTLWYEVRLQD